MQENQDVSNQEMQVPVKAEKSTAFGMIKVVGLLFLFGLFYFLGSYFSSLGSLSSQVGLPVAEPESEAEQESGEQLSNETTTAQVDISDLQAAIVEQQYPRYAVVDNRELVLVSLNGGQEIRPDISDFRFGGGHLGYGSTDPLNAPDLFKVAYIDSELRIHVMNTKGDVDLLISEDLEVDYISGWSTDSEKLLFHVRGDTIDRTLNPDGMMYEIPDTVAYNKAGNPNGFYLFNLATGELRHLSVMERTQFYSWIDADRILVNNSPYNSDRYVIFDTDSYVADFSLIGSDIEKDFGTQYSFSQDGSKWAITWHGGDGGTNSASIVLADFPEATGVEIMKANFAQIQGPIISPDGRQVAFRGYDEVNGPLYTYLYDGSDVEKVIDGFPRAWVSNTEFLVVETDPSHATNPQMSARLFVYNTETRSATQVHSFEKF